jgi:hypothetical protein
MDYGSADQDPKEIFTDPQHCLIGSQSKGYKNENGNFIIKTTCSSFSLVLSMLIFGIIILQ